MKLRHILYFAAVAAAIASCGKKPADGEHVLRVLTTNDVHGAWFDSSYVDGSIKNSLYAVNYYIDSVRTADGAENVLLIDAGDCLQGDNAPYYFNYVDTETPHLFPRLVNYMKYDAVCVGNHDIETGHPVYDRIRKDLNGYGIPFLAGNAIRTDNGKPYFEYYKTFDRAGLKVLVLGYTNANMKAWLTEALWSGMTFENLIPLVQNDVNKIQAKEKADVTIVAVHSGTGNGDGTILESQALDLFNSLEGVDLVICSHDHSAKNISGDRIGFLNSGSHSRNIGYGAITVNVKDGKVESKSIETSLIPVDEKNVDPKMRDYFHKDYEAVKAFTLRTVGELKEDLYTRDAYKGMNSYVNFIHSLGLQHADISFAAPLTFDGKVTKGTLIYNDLFTIYPFENQMFVMSLYGKEIKTYLEYSYEKWINTVSDVKAIAAGKSSEHVLKIEGSGSARYGTSKWFFIDRPYNFDSAAGLNYTVDVTKPYGERINIESMADGCAFDPEHAYKVAVTSYRSSGEMMKNGAGIEDTESRIIERYPEYRELVYNYLQENGEIDPAVINALPALGHWEFIPQPEVSEAIARDMELIF